MHLATLTISLTALALCALAAEERPVELGLAAGYPGDVGIAADDAVIIASGFEDGISDPLKITRKGVSVVEDASIAHTGSRYAQIVATRGQDQGGDIKIQFPGVDRCFMRVYVRFHRDTVMPHHFINLRGHTPTYQYRWGGGAGLRPPGGTDGAFGTTLEPPKGEHGGWKFYTYWHQMRSWQTPEGKPDGRDNAFYGNNFRAAAQPPPLEHERWICLELMVQLNTIGERDGEQAFWIDGVKYGHWRPGSPEGTWLRDGFHTQGKWNTKPAPFEGFDWRTHPTLTVNKAQLQWYLSKRTYAKATVDENIVGFDNLVIATEYIGPIADTAAER